MARIGGRQCDEGKVMKERDNTLLTYIKPGDHSLNMTTPPQLLQKNMPIESLGVHAITHLHKSQSNGVPLEATHADRG